jgi:hypothetical protein
MRKWNKQIGFSNVLIKFRDSKNLKRKIGQTDDSPYESGMLNIIQS